MILHQWLRQLAAAVSSRKNVRFHAVNSGKRATAGSRSGLIEELELRTLLSSTSGFTDNHDDSGDGDGHDHEILPQSELDVATAFQDGGFLTKPSGESPLQIAEQYIRANAEQLGFAGSESVTHVVTDSYESSHTGVTHIHLQQTLNGLPVENALLNVNVMPDGQILNVGSTFVGGISPEVEAGLQTEPDLSAVDAVTAFAASMDLELSGELTLISDVSIESVAPWIGSEINEPQYQSTVLSSAGISTVEIPAHLTYVATGSGIELAWKLNVQTTDWLHWYDAAVSAEDGDILIAHDWGHSASYNVYEIPKQSPYDGPRTTAVDPQDATASPFGWHDTNGVAGAEFTTTQGNNVFAYLDRNNDNNPDTGSAPDGGAALDFDFPIDLSQEPDQYQPASVTNLFYWNNIIHDIHYQYGFDEASGNFQENNYGNGGAGGDFVHAQAQDGADLGTRNNANFFTPPDGSNPRMQMYLFSLTTPERGSSQDSEIIIHEYGHGVSNRLTGGPGNSGALSNIQSRGMGEGWSDIHSLLLTQEVTDSPNVGRGVGTYALGQAITGPGVRTQPYSFDLAVNDHTYGDIVGSGSVHFIGETWATTLWDLNWALIQGSSLDPMFLHPGLGFDPDFYNGSGGNNLAMQLIMDGMKLQPANPSFLDARDGILAADVALTGGLYQDTIWKVFGRRGMGFSADDGGSSATTNVTEAYDLPPTLGPPELSPVNPPGASIDGMSYTSIISAPGEVDDITLDLDADQTLSVAVTPGASLQVTVEVLDPNSAVVSSATGVSDGAPVLLQLLPVAIDGTYTINITGAAGTVGGYTLDVALNAALEVEAAGGPSNNSIFTAQNIDASAQPVVDAASSRLAVVGDSGGGNDFFEFTLTAGVPNTFAVSGTGVSLDLFNGAGARLATGISGASPDQSINNYVPTTTGTYSVRVTGAGGYQLIVTRNADFEYENNDDLTEPQRLQAGGRVLGGTGADPAAGTPFLPTGGNNNAAGDGSGPDAANRDLPPADSQKIIVQFADSFSAVQIDDWAADNNAWIGTRFGQVFNGAIVHVPAAADVQAVAQAWNAQSDIVSAEPDQIGEYLATPDDTRFSEMWGLNNTGQTGGTADADIDAPEAWDLITDSSNVVIAIVDSGVNYNHPDLNPVMWVNALETPGNGVDDDGNGFIDDVFGINADAGTGDPMDGLGHGTHVAGTAAAFGNNAQGVTGVNWNASIMALGIGTAGPSMAAAIVALDYMVDQKVNHGVNVVSSNHSYGVGGSVAFETAIQASINAGIVFVAAAGNSNENNDVTMRRPSAYPFDGIIAVAATDDNDAKAGFSSFGATTVDLGAPGVDILSTMLTAGTISDPSGYGAISGTSMASPHVAGAAALLAAYNPTATVAEIKAALLDGSDPVPSMAGITVSGGRLNLRGALDQLGPGSGTGPVATAEDFSDDFYTIAVAAGDVLTLSTTTPFDAPLNVQNTLDPIIELFDPDGAMVASDDNGGPDGKNSFLTHTALLDGDYVVRVGAVSGVGAYTLDIATATGMDPDPFVEVSDPPFGAVAKIFPATWTLTFNEPLLIPTLDPGDLTFDGNAVTTFRFLDGKTVEFDIDPAWSRGEVTYDVVLAGGSVLDLQGRPNAEWVTTFTRDITPPTIITTTWNALPFPATAVIGDGPLLFEAQFTEQMLLPPESAIALLDTVRGDTYAPISIVAGPDTVTIEFPHLPESDYELTLVGATGAFEDRATLGLDGEPLGADPDGAPSGDGFVDGDYVVNFRVDIESKALEFQRLEPFGLLLSQSGPNEGYINDLGDLDVFTFYAEAGEVISAEVLQLNPTGFSSTALTLSDASGPIAGPFVGVDAYMAPYTIPADGMYQLGVRGSAFVEYDFTVNRGLVTEFIADGDTEDGFEVPIDPTLIPFGADGGLRYGAAGESETIVDLPIATALYGVQPVSGNIVQVNPVSGAIIRSFAAPAGITAADVNIGLSGAEDSSTLLYVNTDVSRGQLLRLDPADGSVISTETTGSWDLDGLGYENDGASDLIFTSHSAGDMHRQVGFSGPETFGWVTGAPVGGVGGDGFDRQFGFFTDGMIREYDPFNSVAPLSVLPSPAPNIQGLAFDGTNLYASAATGELFTLNPDTGAVLNTATVAGGALFGLGTIGGGAPPLPDLVYVVEREDGNNPGGEIGVFDLDGNRIDTFDDPVLDDGVINDIEVGPTGDLFLALDLDGINGGTGQLVHFRSDGTLVGTIPVPPKSASLGFYPFGFEILQDGRFLIPQQQESQVLVLNTDGSLASTISTPGIEPVDAAVLSDGTLVVADISVAAPEFSLNIRTDDTFWIGLGLADRVERRDRTGAVLDTHTIVSPVVAQAAADGALFVTQGPAVDEVSKFDSAGTLELTFPATNPIGLAVASGEVFGTPAFSADGLLNVLAVGTDGIQQFQIAPEIVDPYAVTGYFANVLVNGGFETGDFTGWTTAVSGPPYAPWSVSSAGAGGGIGSLAATSPTEGSFSAWNGFDGESPLEFTMYQDIIVPANGVLEFDYRAQWDFNFGDPALIGRDLIVELQDPDDSNVLQTLFTFNTGDQSTNPTGDTGWLTETIDVSAFGGEHARLMFREVIPESSTGPGQMEFDNIRLDGTAFATEPDLDEFTIDLSAYVGETIDLLLDGRNGQNYAGALFDLLAPDGTTVLASGAPSPLGNAGSYDQAILGFTVPASGVYTIQVESDQPGSYGIGVVHTVPFDLEPNNGMADPLQTFTPTNPPLGYLNGDQNDSDWFELDLPAGQPVEITTDTLFDDPAYSPLNALDPALEVYAPDGTTLVASDLSSAADGRNAVARFTTTVAGLYKIAISAEAGSGAGEYSVNVVTPQLTLTVDNPVISEADGSAAASAILTRNGSSGSDLTVTLTNSDNSEVDIPLVVIIPAGQSSVAFQIDAVDDLLLDGTQTVLIDATAADFVPASVSIDVTDDDVAGITVTAGQPNLVVSETGTTQTFDVVLNAGPLSDVEITVVSADSGEADVDLGRLVFTPADWMTPQTVTVRGIDDFHVDGTQSVSMTVSIDTAVSDAAFGSVADETVAVDVLDDDTATVTIADTSVTEGGLAQFTLTLDNAVENSFSVNVTFGDGTAFRSIDFINSLPSATFTGNAGETQQVSVFTIDDAIVEVDETFTARLTSNDPLVTAVDGAIGTIVDNDDAILIISSVEVTEGQNMVFDVRLTATTDNPFDVQVNITDDTANGGAGLPADYEAMSPLLKFAGQNGETQRFIIPTFDDLVREPSETFNITLVSTHPLVDDSAAPVGTIHDNDTATLTVDDVTATEGDSLTFTVTLDNNVSEPFDVTATLSDNSATGGTAAPADYGNQPQTQTFAGTAGESWQFTVPTFDNTVAEATERFLVGLSATTGLVNASDTATGIINDDDSATISIDDAAVVEGSGGGNTLMTFTVTLDGEVDRDVGVNFNTVNDTATDAGGDLTFTTGKLTFAAFAGPGPQTVELTVPVTADDVVELDESFFISLHTVQASGRDVTITDNEARADIMDDDSAVVNIGDVAMVEGTQDEDFTEFHFEVTLSAVVDVQVDINYETADGTALVSDNDYVPRVGVLDFAGNSNGPQTLTVVVQVTADEKVELDEDFTLNLVNVLSGGRDVTLGDTEGRGDVSDDDMATLSVDHTSAMEGDVGDTNFEITLVLDAPVDTTVGVDINLADGSAVAGIDYRNDGNGTHFDFAPGTQTLTFTVPVIGDRRIEPNESFTAFLSNLTTNGRNVVLDATPAVATILNDDHGALDVDDNLAADAATDGILALRYLFGFRGSALTSKAIGAGAGKSTPGDVEAVLDSSLQMLDVDGNGVRDAATDGILIIRYLFGFRGDALVSSAVGLGATRTTGDEIAAFLDDFTPLAPPPVPPAPASGGGATGTSSSVTVTVNGNTPTVTWVPVNNADRYRLIIEQRDTAQQIVSAASSATSFTAAGAFPAGNYRIWVEALGTGGSVVATLTTTFTVSQSESPEGAAGALSTVQTSLPGLRRLDVSADMNPAANERFLPDTTRTANEPDEARGRTSPLTHRVQADQSEPAIQAADSTNAGPARQRSSRRHRKVAGVSSRVGLEMLDPAIGSAETDDLMEQLLTAGEWIE